MAYQSPYNYDWRYWESMYTNGSGNRMGYVNIHRYRCERLSSTSINCDAGKAMQKEVINRIRDRYKKITGKDQIGNPLVIPQEKKDDWFPHAPLVIDKTDIVRAFNGKGSPEEIELAIQMTIATKQVKDTLVDVQKMVDKCIGLDCTGFVGNFTKQLGLMKASGDYGPSSITPTFAQTGIKRERFMDIQLKDVLIWPDPRHIAIVSHPPDTDNWLLVTESAASLDGLDSRWYKFTGKTFKKDKTVDGGGKGTMMEFRRPNGNGGWKVWELLVCRIA